MRASAQIRGILALIGFTSVIAQVVLMRELMVAFYGNEISLGMMLACWLFWTALGSGVLGRTCAGWEPRKLVATLECVVALTLPPAIAAVRMSRPLFQSAGGELLGVGPMFLTTLAALGLFCPFSGWLFAAGSRMLIDESGETAASATSSVYVLEAAGSALGGLLASVVLIGLMPSFGIAALIAGLNLLAAVALLGKRALVPAIAATAVLGLAVRPAERLTLQYFWHGFRVVESRNSVYGSLAVLEAEGIRSLAENGLIVTTVPDPAAAEEAVHLPLLEHAHPRRVLVIGGCADGSLAEVLKYASVERVDCVELDPMIPVLARRFLPGAVPADSRVRVDAVDGVRFLKSGGERFDVIIVNLPEPQTAQLNRFYTAEFFASAARRLRSGGLAAVAFTVSENYLAPESQALLRCISKTMATAFPYVIGLPGETVHLFGSAAPLITDPRQIVQRLRARGIKTQYISEHFLPFRLMAERVKELAAKIQPDDATPINRDFAPIAYYFDLIRWSGRFGSAYSAVLERAGQARFWVVAAALPLLLAAMALSMRASPAVICAGTTGFTMIGVEIVLLLGFQALHGYVYQELALLVAGFMAGMSAGSWMALRRLDAPGLAPIQIAVAAAPFGAFGLLLLGGIGASSAALACGALGGFQFGAASRHYYAHVKAGTGKLYAVDLAGSCAGALLLSAYAVPVFGFVRTSWLMALINLAPALAALAGRRKPAR